MGDDLIKLNCLGYVKGGRFGILEFEGIFWNQELKIYEIKFFKKYKKLYQMSTPCIFYSILPEQRYLFVEFFEKIIPSCFEAICIVCAV
jgi:hypothetical protein